MIQPFIEHITVKTVSETPKEGVFEIEGLAAGYGITIGNALRRILLSSLPGAAITQAKIKGVGHKFTTIPGVLEDVVELTLNIKKIRFVMTSDEPQVLHLKSKGEGEVRAGDFETGPQVRVITPDQKIATLTDKKAEFDLEVTVEKGVGYSPVEAGKRCRSVSSLLMLCLRRFIILISRWKICALEIGLITIGSALQFGPTVR